MGGYPKEMIEELYRGADLLIQRVEMALQNGTRIGELVAVEELKTQNAELLVDVKETILILQILRKAEESELQANYPNRVFANRQVADLVQLYKQLVFYLRRIEFRLPDELCMELIPFLLEEKISDILLITVINETDLLFHKREILCSVQNYFSLMDVEG